MRFSVRDLLIATLLVALAAWHYQWYMTVYLPHLRKVYGVGVAIVWRDWAAVAAMHVAILLMICGIVSSIREGWRNTQ